MEVEVVRARELVGRPGAKLLPTVTVKLHLMERRICIEKHKTWPQTARTLEPDFRETFVFMEDHQYANLLCFTDILNWRYQNFCATDGYSFCAT